MTPELSSALNQVILQAVIAIGGFVLASIGLAQQWAKRREKEAAARNKAEIEKIKLENDQQRELIKAIHDGTEHQAKLVDSIIKHTETLSDFGRVLSANSSVLVGHTETIGELSERTGAVRDGVGELNETVKKIESAVNAIKASIGDTGDVSLTERISQLQRLVLELNTKPLQVITPTETKPETPAA